MKINLEILAQNCQKENPQPGWTYAIAHAKWRPCLVLRNAHAQGWTRDVSPRLTKTQLAQWITAFLTGIQACKAQAAHIQNKKFVRLSEQGAALDPFFTGKSVI